MADEFDACECFWNHEIAMRRLLSLVCAAAGIAFRTARLTNCTVSVYILQLRQGQSYCNDNECTDRKYLCTHLDQYRVLHDGASATRG